MNRELDVRTLLKALRKYYPIVIAAVLSVPHSWRDIL